MRYIGSKVKLLETIHDFIEEQLDTNKLKTFCDLFSGTTSVARYFKGEYQILSNDFMYYSYVLQRAYLDNDVFPRFLGVKEIGINDPLAYLNALEGTIDEQYFITHHYSPYENSDRMYFTVDNAKKMDAMRIKIEEWKQANLLEEREYFYLIACLIEAVPFVSNITGTYGAYLKSWDKRAFKVVTIEPLELSKGKSKKNQAYNRDALTLIREIEGDVLYIDPPYTIVEYSSAYHVLETIARYDYPDLKGITGQRVGEKRRSNFSKKKKAYQEMDKLVSEAKFKYIILSYSNHGIVSEDEILEIFERNKKPGTEVIIKTLPYRVYKNINKTKKKQLNEYLFLIEKKDRFVKSPLNYSGGKYPIIDSISQHLPKKMNTFMDLFAGGFNVGANIIANRIIYNDINPFVKALIETLYETQLDDIIAFIEDKISSFNLGKENKDEYIQFREYFNSFEPEKRHPLDLLVLIMHTFRHQIRYNSKHEFNNPYGRCTFNDSIRAHLIEFVQAIQNKTVTFTSFSFDEIDLDQFGQDDVIYCDPPYIITNAAYNDGKRGFEGWTQEHEVKLLEFLDQVNQKNIKFMLSNVLEHKEKVNHVLKEWIERNHYQVIEIHTNKRKEILIVNYEVE